MWTVALLVTLILLAAVRPEFLQAATNAISDSYQKFKPRPYDPSLRVKIVAINERSLKIEGQWPWPRRTLAELQSRLAAAGARLIVHDILYAEPDRESKLGGREDGDQVFAESLRLAPTILAQAFTDDFSDGRPVKSGQIFYAGDLAAFSTRAKGAVAPLPILASSAAGIGAAQGFQDQTGIFRSGMTLIVCDGKLHPSLAVEAARILLDRDGYARVKFSTQGAETLFLDDAPVPVDRQGGLLLYDTGPRSERFVSATDVLSGKADTEAFRDAVVLVGSTALGMGDIKMTPGSNAMPGVETHAQLIEQILSRTFLIRPNTAPGIELIGAFVLCLLLIPAERFGFGRSGWGLAVAFAAGLSWYAFAQHQILVDPVYPIVSVTLFSILMPKRPA